MAAHVGTREPDHTREPAVALSPVHTWAAQWMCAAVAAGVVLGAACSLVRQVWRG